ncbi:MAG: lasso peptide biosynthesis B2 protein, partial [bacterium]
MKSSIDRLRRFLQLPRRERFILLAAWGLLVLLEPALHLIPFPRLLTFAQRVSTRRATAPLEPSVARLAWLVERAARYTPGEATCLKQTLVLSSILGRRGVATAFRIGVARPDGVLSAHAWLEYE